MKTDQVHKVVQLLSQSSELESIKSEYYALMLELDLIDKHTNCSTVQIINTTLGQLTPEEVLEHILYSWIEKFGNMANIQNLISVFENFGYVDIPSILLECDNVPIKHEPTQKQIIPVQSNSNTLTQRNTKAKAKVTACKYYKDSTESTTEIVHLLESSGSMEKPSGWNLCNKQNETYCEVLGSETQRKLCKYFSIFILFQLCTALSFHAQLRSFTNQASVQNLGEGNESEPCPNIIVGSYIEYQMEMNKLSRNPCSVNVFIDLRTKNDWQLGVPLKDPEKISQLTLKGDIPLNLMVSILQESKQLKELILINSNSGICDAATSFNESFVYKVVNLRYLENITFNNATTCSQTYQFISQNAHMKNLERFSIENGIINAKNAHFIRDILLDHSQRLKTLSFRATKWSSLLFDKNIPVFSFVENIYLDFISDNNNTCFLSTRFPDMFPSLKIFESRRGLMPWTLFQRLLKCPRLTKVVVSVNVPSHYYKPIKTDFLSQASSTLRHLEITFNFPNKNYKDSCEFEGIEKERKLFSMLLVKANCKIRNV